MMLKCMKCKVEPIKQPVTFKYLNHEMHYEVPVCPICGRIYISRELAEGKILTIEQELEDK